MDTKGYGIRATNPWTSDVDTNGYKIDNMLSPVKLSYTQGTFVPISNTVTETQLFPVGPVQSGSTFIPGNFVREGMVLRFTFAGDMRWAGTANILTFRLYFANAKTGDETKVADLEFPLSSTSNGMYPFRIQGELCVESTFVLLALSGYLRRTNTATFLKNDRSFYPYSPSRDQTDGLNVRGSFQWSSADPNNIYQNQIVLMESLTGPTPS